MEETGAILADLLAHSADEAADRATRFTSPGSKLAARIVNAELARFHLNEMLGEALDY